MNTATTALGGILASIAIPGQVPSAGSRRHEARPNAGQGSATTANSRGTRSTTMLAVYVALQLGSVVLGIAISHKPAATSGSVMALADAPKLPIDITEAF